MMRSYRVSAEFIPPLISSQPAGREGIINATSRQQLTQPLLKPALVNYYLYPIISQFRRSHLHRRNMILRGAQ